MHLDESASSSKKRYSKKKKPTKSPELVDDQPENDPCAKDAFTQEVFLFFFFLYIYFLLPLLTYDFIFR